jgi:hypothetical protein
VNPLGSGDRQHATPVTALVPSVPNPAEAAGLNLDGPLSQLPVELDVGVPVRGFRVRNLLALEPGILVPSRWGHSDDLPVLSGNQTLAWSEFEVMDTHLAVRLTRLP